MVLLAPRDERLRQAAAVGRTAAPLDDGRPDADLVRDAVAGDTSAFDLLARRHQRRAVAVAYRILGHVHDAREVTQDALLRAFQSLDTLKQPERFGPWLVRIVSNLSLNRRRTRVGKRYVPLENESDAGPSNAPRRAHNSAAPPADDLLIRRERLATVLQAIRQLPDRQRTAILLFAVEGKPQSEIARIMGCNVQLVKWYVFQARKSLRADPAINND